MVAEALRHHQAGDLNEAERLYRLVLAAAPGHADSLHLLGVMAHQRGRDDVAAGLIRKAIAIDGNIAFYHSNLGSALIGLGQLDAAAVCCRRSLELNPDDVAALLNLGVVAEKEGRFDDAAAYMGRVLAINPNDPGAYNNLGNTRRTQGRLDEAAACFRKALDLKPNDPDAHNNFGATLRDQGHLNEAAVLFARAVALKPEFPDAHHNLGMALLALGDMAAGWREYEWRWGTPQLQQVRRSFVQPQWRGGAAEGRTLLIHAEQGFGDTLQFCRYAPLAAARGFRVIIEAPRPLVRLLRSLPAVDQVVGYGEDLPAFDLHCPMLSMPLAFETTVATIPSALFYLRADTAQTAAWRTRLAGIGGGALRVGLVWAGNPRSHSPELTAVDRRRSLAPEQLAPLFSHPGVQFFSLQKGGPAAPAEFPLIDFMGEMTDFVDTAALISNLDLVISVDTAVAHLAAALGKPVWMLDRFDPCWRWLTGRSDSPWYPTLTLYRQARPGDWGPVLADVVRDLHRLAQG
jgi:Flp pilus assembly protein TadD